MLPKHENGHSSSSSGSSRKSEIEQFGRLHAKMLHSGSGKSYLPTRLARQPPAPCETSLTVG